MRIVSLVPSLTKTLCDLGLKERIAGITNFCVDPPDLYRTATRVGGTKNPDLKIIADLKPTHILVNGEENRAEDIDRLTKAYNVLVTFPKSPLDVPSMLINVGAFLGQSAAARVEADRLIGALEGIERSSQHMRALGKRCVYLIWRDPWMVVGRDTYISRFLELLGFENVVDSETRYPVMEIDEIVKLSPDVIFMSSEPWPFRRRDADALRTVADGLTSEIMWIDGKAMSWFGTTTRETLEAVISSRAFYKKL